MRVVQTRESPSSKKWLVPLSLSICPFKSAEVTPSAADVPAEPVTVSETDSPPTQRFRVKFPDWARIQQSQDPCALGKTARWSLWGNPYSELQQVEMTEDSQLNLTSTEVSVADWELDALCRLGERIGWTKRLTKRQHREIDGREAFLKTILKRLRIEEPMINVLVIAKLKSGAPRVAEVTHRKDGEMPFAIGYHVLYVDAQKGSCLHVQPEETSGGAKSWSYDQTRQLILQLLGPQTGFLEETAFLESLTTDDETVKYLRDAFSPLGKTIYKLFPPGLLKVSMKRIDLKDVEPTYDPEHLILQMLQCGIVERDWKLTFATLAARSASPDSFAAFTLQDFFGESALSSALMCNAIVTAETSLDTHLLHQLPGGFFNHVVFSTTDSSNNETAHILHYGEGTKFVSRVVRPRTFASSSFSAIHARGIIEDVLSAAIDNKEGHF